ncbi:hypothetical protein FB381_1216 [Nocardioides albertanoniae]|uniref:Trypsin-like peptidase n=1 Tax=Nocardioides albertanoniae TaxID=1175486 RepID=A0A543A422_9ACTN|nr:hypothetical protein [Nocardioides albertanoniae]TQL67341.1 hypothetical protein FB381_1216 [Nocardioides albertanoniae]
MLRTRRSVRRAAALAASVLTAALVPALIPTPAHAWAPADTARITPGVQMYTKGAQCTSNFVYTDSASNVYVGYAAHCAGLGEATDTNGCAAKSLPVGTPVTFNEGGSLLDEGTVIGKGTLVYSSWETMQKRGTKDPDTCAYNDLALVKVSDADKGKVNPSIPIWGGPTGIDTDGTAAGDRVYSYGNSSLRADLDLLSPKVGLSLGDDVSGTRWSHPLYNVTPGIPGDSGSGFLSGEGKAVGTLSTLGLAPLPASNNIGDLDLELDYAKATSGISGLRLVNGTEPFKGAL